MADNLQIALTHAARGWCVFPCGSDKRPLTAHGYKDATNDPEIIREWWTKHPGALIGLPAARSGFWVLDIDPPEGFDSLAALVNANGGEPITPGISQDTPRGGAHYLYRLPQDVHIPNTAGKLAPGLDLRSDGYICTGSGYTWLEGRSPDEHELTDAPTWLIERIAGMNGRKPPANPLPAGVMPQGDKSQWAASLLDRLASWRCSDYQPWVDVGMALSELGADGLTLFDSWSQRCPEKYPGHEEIVKKWRSFDPGAGITLGSLYHWAQEDDPRPVTIHNTTPPEPEAPPDWEMAEPPQESTTTPPTQAGETPNRFELHSIAEVSNPRTPTTWRVKNLIAEDYLSIWFGEPGCKKTWSLLDLCICVALGKPWLDFETTQCPVLWIDEEMGNNRMLDRLQWAAAGHLADVKKIPLYYVSYGRFDFRNLHDAESLAGLVHQTGAGLLVIDALMEVTPGADENSVKDMKPGLIALDAIAKRTHAATNLIHHANRNGDYRGTSALKGSVDVMLKVESKKTPRISTSRPKRLATSKP